MWPLILALLQASASGGGMTPDSASSLSVHDILVAEYQREAGIPVLTRAILSGDTVLQRYGTRAVGRLRDRQFSFLLDSAIRSPALSVQREAVRAIGLTGPASLLLSGGPLGAIRDLELRALSYESYGRTGNPDESTERTLLQGLEDPSVVVRLGAARGLEALARRTVRNSRIGDRALALIGSVFHTEADAQVRSALLTALVTVAHRDSMIVRAALADTSTEVRRLGVMLGRTWIDDDSPMVRYQALRVAGTCEHAAALTRDTSEHVALLALDVLGEQHCSQTLLLPYVGVQVSWQRQAHATVALARSAPGEAVPQVRELARSPVWQARAWAATGAKLTGDSALLETLSGDTEPNVAAAAIVTAEQAIRAIERDHAGLVLKAATVLRQKQLMVIGMSTDAVADRLKAAFERITRTQPVTWRDPRIALLSAITVNLSPQHREWMIGLLADPDPVLAATAARALSQDATERPPLTLHYQPPAYPTPAQVASLSASTARITMTGRGVMTVRLNPEDAPATVHTFVTLAERGAYNGRTLHRVVPNFVVQGGSPGADEYDPATDFFMRDEVGGRHRRGSFGISTRGADTGDGQIFINLVDNLRLDTDYTVFAEMIAGFDVMDRIQEGDVIESIVIERADDDSGASRERTTDGRVR